MSEFATSRDGTRIAFDRLGAGPPVVLVGGLLCDRDATKSLAQALATSFAVINFDRRGRGESGNTEPYSIEREIEDIRALIDAAGGAAALYGHSSGAGLALNAAAGGAPVTRLILHEPPYSTDDAESLAGARALAEQVRDTIAGGRAPDAVRLFFEASGFPPEMVDDLSNDPKRKAMARTMLHDFAVMGELSGGGAIPEAMVAAIKIPTLVIAGGASLDFFRDIASRIARLLPDGRYVVLDGQDHGAPGDVVAPVVERFLLAADAPNT